MQAIKNEWALDIEMLGSQRIFQCDSHWVLMILMLIQHQLHPAPIFTRLLLKVHPRMRLRCCRDSCSRKLVTLLSWFVLLYMKLLLRWSLITDMMAFQR